MIERTATGLVYRNPKPHLRAIHAWHPSLALMPTGEMVAAFDVGQAVESLDYHTVTTHSHDGGATWSQPQPLIRDDFKPTRPSTHSCRITRIGSDLVGLGAWFHRDDPEEGLVNRANLGYVPTDLFLTRSGDGGRTWGRPEPVTPPLVGPSWELCHRVVALRDGRWLLPCSTWRGWDGQTPSGMKAVAFVSHDRGKTWPEYLGVMDRSADGVWSWEQGLCELADGRLLSVMWWFNEPAGRAEPTPYALYTGGKRFGDPRPTGLLGETAKLITLRDGRVLCLYRRVDKPGLWAHLCRIDGDRWVNLADAPVWTGAASAISDQANASEGLSGLKFGFPSMVELPDGQVMVVFWCLEEGVHNIRWAKIKVGS